MAVSAVTARGSNTRSASGASTSGTVSANIVVGRLLVIGCSTKNTATADGVSSTHTSITDAAGNTWSKVSEYTETAGVAQDGTTVSIWRSVITTQINNGGTLQVNHGTNDHGIITFTEATISAGTGIAVAQVGVGQNAIAAAVSSLTSREYFLYGCFGAEGSDNTKTADADYAEQFDLRSANSSTATTIHVQTRVATLTADTCTSTGWTNTDPMALLVAFYEPLGLSLPAIASTTVVRTPSARQNLVLPTRASAVQLFAPAVKYKIALPAVATTVSLSAPSLRYTVGLPSITSVLSLFAPGLSGSGIPNVAFLASPLT